MMQVALLKLINYFSKKTSFFHDKTGGSLGKMSSLLSCSSQNLQQNTYLDTRLSQVPNVSMAG
jgi:hypothetical protein